MKKLSLLIVIFFSTATAMLVASPAPPIFQMRLVLDAPSSDSESMTNIIHHQDSPDVKIVLNVQKTVLLDQSAIKSAKAGRDGLGHPDIDIKFTKEGTKRFAEVTRQNIHKQLAIIIDGKLTEAPIIQTEIPGGTAQISGNFSKEQAKDLAKRINEAVSKK